MAVQADFTPGTIGCIVALLAGLRVMSENMESGDELVERCRMMERAMIEASE